MARNWDDFLQRDLHAITFIRALGIFGLNTMFFIATSRIARNLLPIGRFGIRSVTETPLYHNFGPIGVAGALGVFAVGNFVFTQAHIPSTKLSNLLSISSIDMS